MKGMKKFSLVTILIIGAAMISACGADDGGDAGDSGATVENAGSGGDGECGTNSIQWSPSAGEMKSFDHVEGWAEAYSMGEKTGYQITLLNYPRADFSRYDPPTGDQQQFLLALNAEAGKTIEPGTYEIRGSDPAISDGREFVVTLKTADDAVAPGVIDRKSVGKVTLKEADDNHVCGSIDVSSESGINFKGSFDVPVEK